MGLSLARVEKSEVRLTESDLIAGAKNEEDMTFILKDRSTKVSDGIPRNLRPSQERWWGRAQGASRELLTQCGSSFLLLFVFFFLFSCTSCKYTVRLYII